MNTALRRGLRICLMHHKTANFYADGFAPESTSVGSYCDIGSPLGQHSKVQTHVTIPPGWILGNNVFYGPKCSFANDKHPNLAEEFTPSIGIVEDNVVIGMGALIGAGVTLGEGCVIGMGAVVLKDVAPHTTVVGNPAHEI